MICITELLATGTLELLKEIHFLLFHLKTLKEEGKVNVVHASKTK